MIKQISISLFLFLALPACLLHAQDFADIDPVLIQLKGKVVSKEDGLPVPYAHMVNMRTHGGTTTNSQGFFSMEMLNVDSLGISAMGYMKDYIHVPPYHSEDSIFVIWARPIRYAIREVEVTGEANQVNMDGVSTGKPINLAPELRGDAFNTKPPWYAAIFSPASFLQYHISKKEKDKRETRKAIVSEKRWEFLSQYYSKEIVMALTGIQDEEVDSFMVFFNSNGILNLTNNEYQVREAILKQYELYQQKRQ